MQTAKSAPLAILFLFASFCLFPSRFTLWLSFHSGHQELFFSSWEGVLSVISQLSGAQPEDLAGEAVVRAFTLGVEAAELEKAELVLYLSAECGNDPPSSSIHCPPLSRPPFVQQEKQACSFMVVPCISHPSFFLQQEEPSP